MLSDTSLYRQLCMCRLVSYLNDVQDDIANSSMIDDGLKKGIEYRVPSGCIIELDAVYAGDNVGGVTNLVNGATKQPTEDDCCQACRSAFSRALQTLHQTC